MKILVYGINYSPELTGIGKYTGEMVEWLAAIKVMRCGLLPHRLTTRNGRWARTIPPGATNEKRGRHGVALPAVRAKTAEHPETPVASRQFCRQQFFPLMAQRRWKPDRIIGVVPTLFCTPGMRLLAKLSGARTVLHIQDYEVDAMLGLGLAGKGKGGKVAQLATAFERSGLHNVDNVSTISRSMMNKAIERRGGGKRHLLPNWSEIARFQHVADADVDALRNQLGLPDNKNHSLLRQYW